MKRNFKGKKIAIYALAATLAFGPYLGYTANALNKTTSSYVNTVESNNISIDNMMADLEAIATNDNARMAGFEGEHDAANYMVDQFKELGLNTRKQVIKNIDIYMDLGSSIAINGENIAGARTMTYSPVTKGIIEGDLVYAGLGKPEECASANLKGKIALIKRGELSFAAKAENAYQSGAKGVIIYNNVESQLNGTLGTIGNVPTIGIDKATGDALQARIVAGEAIKSSMEVKAIIEEDSHSYNVIAKLPAAKNPRTAQTIVIGAHFDSVNCAGANDNASGTVSIMEAARILSQPENAKNLNYNIEFIGFGAEEIGLIGSKEYVRSLQASNRINKVKGMINLDMIGVGNALVQYNSNDKTSHELTDLAKNVADRLGYLETETAQDLHSTSSDHAPFEAVGIPSTFLTYRMDKAGTLDPYYHQKTDVIPTINPQWLYNTTDVVINTVLEMQSQPPRKVSPFVNYSLQDMQVLDNLENLEIPSN